MFKQKLFTAFLTIFIFAGSASTIWAMQVNPPNNLDHVVMGNIDGDLVEVAVQTDNEELVSAYPAENPNFFAITPDNDEFDEDQDGLAILEPLQERGHDNGRGRHQMFHDIIKQINGKAKKEPAKLPTTFVTPFFAHQSESGAIAPVLFMER